MNQAFLAASAALLLAVSVPAASHGPASPGETVTQVFERKLPNAPGKALIVLEVLYAPGGASPPHLHPDSAFVYAYVLSGEIISAVGDEPPRSYHAGESWYELPGSRHPVSRNASRTAPAKLLAIFVGEEDDRELVLPDINR